MKFCNKFQELRALKIKKNKPQAAQEQIISCRLIPLLTSVVEPQYFDAAPGKNFDAAPALAPTLLYSKANFLKRTKVYTYVVHMTLYDSYC
jgi:hypothetical protein